MSYVEIETGEYVKRWAFWNPATWSIPKLYWDAWSQEQRLHAICRQLEKVIKYADYLGVNIDDIAARLKAIEEGQLDPIIEAAVEQWFEDHEEQIYGAITELQEEVAAIKADGWVTTNRIADGAVTNGKLADDSVTTAKIEDESITEAKLSDELKVTKNFIEDLTAENQGLYLPDSGFVNAVRVKNDGTLESALFNSGMNFGNYHSYDAAAAISIMGTYLINASNFYYGNAYTGTTYEGDYDSPTLVDPREHRNVNSQMPIDCATFTTLCANGIPYDLSTYNGRDNLGFHYMYNPTSEAVKPYWRYTMSRDNIDDPIGYGRLLTDALAKMLFDNGNLEFMQGASENLQLGDMVFAGNADNRYMGITHCAFVGGALGFTSGNMIVVESDSGFTNGIITRPLNQTGILGSLKARVTPNWSAGVRLHNDNKGYMFTYKNTNLSTNPITWMPLNDSPLARVITIVPNSSGAVPVTVSAESTSTGTTNTVTRNLSITGAYIIYLPYGWTNVSITSSSSTTCNVCLQLVGSDNFIHFESRS